MKLGGAFVVLAGTLVLSGPAGAQDDPANLLFVTNGAGADFQWSFGERWIDVEGEGGGDAQPYCGRLINGTDGAFNYFASMVFEPNIEWEEACTWSFSLAYSDRGFVMDPYESWSNDLTTVRQIYVPQDSDFTRWVDRMTNGSDQDEEVTVQYGGSVTDWRAIVVFDTSSGDDEVDSDDNWLVADDEDEDGGMPAVAVIWQSEEAENKATQVSLDNWGGFTATFEVTVPGDQSVALVLFAVQSETREGAADLAGELTALGGAGTDELDEDIEWLVNFVPTAPGAPRVRMNGPYVVDEGGETVVHATAEDPEGDEMTYSWDLDGDEIFGDLEDTLDAPVSAANVDGPAGIRLGLRVTDELDNESIRHVTVRVDNVPPTIESTPGTEATTDELYSYQIVASDFATDTLSYSIDEGPPGMTVSNSGLVQWTPAPDGRGPDVPCVFVVTDDDGGEAEQEVTISMSGAPTLDVGGPYSVAEGGEVVLSPTAEDPEGDPITWAWDLDGDGVFDDSREDSVTWSAAGIDGPAEGFQVRVAITDGVYEVAAAIPVDVRNVGPQFMSQPPDVAVVDREWVYAVEAVDPGGDAFTLEFDEDEIPAGMTMDEDGNGNGNGNGNGRTFRWTPNAADLEVGQHDFVITARDEDNGRETQDAIITVRENSPPPLPEIAFPTGDEAVRTTSPTVILENVDDPDGDPVQYFIEVDYDLCFCTPEKQASGALPEGDLVTQWSLLPLNVDPAAVPAGHTDWYIRRWASDGLSSSDPPGLSLFSYQAPDVEQPDDDEEARDKAGCACRTGGAHGPNGAWLLAGVAIFGAILSRRRRRR
ncbi:MAG: hypothetical protein HYY06_05245 [Deltaproteobacteria bacterium]|nr:hypothetical protein [Deltaproteobacteria bacterium]